MGRPAFDLTGQTFERLTVVKKAVSDKHGHVMWKCRCICGNTKNILTNSLISGRTKSCGCFNRETTHNFTDITGQTFGRLTVINRTENRRSKKVQWKCLCECGGTTITGTHELRSGNTKSCGCFGKEQLDSFRKTHEKFDTPEYDTWCHMKNRCYNPKDVGFKDYGGRGITICNKWRHDFLLFFNHIGPKPPGNYSVERIDNNGNYEPGNVRWATPKEQTNNQRSNHNITFRGVTMTRAQWAEALGINKGTLSSRIRQLRWPIEKALTQPVNHYLRG